MADYIGWRTGLFVLGLLSLAAGTLFWLRLPASRHFVPHRLHLFSLLSSATSHLKDPVLLGLYMQGFLLLGAYMAFYNYLGYRLMGSPYGFTQAAIGLIFLITLAGSFTAGWTAHLATRLGRSVSFCFLVVLMLAGVVISLASPLWLIIAGAAVMTFAFYGAHSVASGWVSIRASRGKSQAASFYLFSYYTGSSLIGWAGGHAWSAAGWPGVVATIGAGLFVALLVAFSLHVAARCGQKSSIMDF
jgi:YNFM family putative membrane transporter